MSRQTARIALDQMTGRPSLIATQYITNPAAPEVTSHGLFADMRDLSASVLADEQRAFEARKDLLVEAYGLSPNQGNGKPFAYGDGTAVIPVHGALINRFAYSFGYVTGYNFIRSQTAAAQADPDVRNIVYDVNSNGGSVAGCPETGAMIAGLDKPSMAVVDSNCYSAAYWLASQTDRIVATPSAGVGSIGVVMMHIDVSKALDQMGVNVTFIHAGEHKVDGNMFEPLSKEVTSELQGEVNALYDDFTATVAQGRGLEQSAVKATEARTFRAQEALGLGLIDAIQTPSEAVNSLSVGQEDDAFASSSGENQMSEKQTTVAAPVDTTAQTEAAARTAERARIAGIQNHAEAAGRAALASHLALNTDLSVEAAGAILAASEKKAEVTSSSSNPLLDAMRQTSNPNAGSGDGNGDGAGGASPAQRILAAYGVKPNTVRN